MRLLGSARRDQLRAGRNAADHDAQHVVAGGILQLMQVVQHEHERRTAGSQRCGDERRRPAECGTAISPNRVGQPLRARRDPAHAEASTTSSAIGSSSNRSSETHATGRVSALAHCASRVDFPYPAGAVTATIRRPLERAASMRAARLTALRRESRGAVSFASSSWRSSSTSDVTSAGASSSTPEAYSLGGVVLNGRAAPTRATSRGRSAPTAGPTRPEQYRRCLGDPRSVRDRGRRSAASRR